MTGTEDVKTDADSWRETLLDDLLGSIRVRSSIFLRAALGAPGGVTVDARTYGDALLQCRRVKSSSPPRERSNGTQRAVIGSGQGGTPLAIALANVAWRTAVIEREHVGGPCINEGCTPTKTMVSSGRVAYLAALAADHGVRTSAMSVDMMAVRDRKRSLVHAFRSSMEHRLEQGRGPVEG